MTFYRKVIRIRGEDSPNVRLAHQETALGREPSGRVILPGVLPYQDYVKRRNTWDKVRQTIGIDAFWYEGAEVLMYPPMWLNRAEQFAKLLEILRIKRIPRAIGIDPAEGGDNTAMCAIDEWGIVDLVSKKTPNTALIKGEIVAFMRKHGLMDQPERVILDAGGGGTQIAHDLREMGYRVRIVSFGESVTPELRRGKTPFGERKESKEDRHAYTNRRAEMYGMLRILLDPQGDASEWDHSRYGEWSYDQRQEPAQVANIQAPMADRFKGPDGKLRGFGIPNEYFKLRHQLSPIPLLYDYEGKLYLLPKNPKPGAGRAHRTSCLRDLIGHSPDESDSLVLAVYGMIAPTGIMRAGVG